MSILCGGGVFDLRSVCMHCQWEGLACDGCTVFHVMCIQYVRGTHMFILFVVHA